MVNSYHAWLICFTHHHVICILLTCTSNVILLCCIFHYNDSLVLSFYFLSLSFRNFKSYFPDVCWNANSTLFFLTCTDNLLITKLSSCDIIMAAPPTPVFLSFGLNDVAATSQTGRLVFVFPAQVRLRWGGQPDCRSPEPGARSPDTREQLTESRGGSVALQNGSDAEEQRRRGWRWWWGLNNN